MRKFFNLFSKTPRETPAIKHQFGSVGNLRHIKHDHRQLEFDFVSSKLDRNFNCKDFKDYTVNEIELFMKNVLLFDDNTFENLTIDQIKQLMVNDFSGEKIIGSLSIKTIKGKLLKSGKVGKWNYKNIKLNEVVSIVESK